MFGRDEKLKRLEAEKRLAEALEELAEEKKEVTDRMASQFKAESEARSLKQEREGLCKTLEEAKGKLRDQSEADLVLASLRIVKAVVFDGKAKEDPYFADLAREQQAAMPNVKNWGGLAGLGSLAQALFR